MKHKKKHREDRRSQRENTTENTSNEPAVPEESYTEMKEQCLKQKLSINLKRLNASAYTRCDESTSSSAATVGTIATAAVVTAAVVEDHKSGTEENSECSDEQIEQHAPDFPPPSPPVMMRITAQAVTSGLSADGRRLGVGDVVWGKIHGFPWWPGKVLSITDTGSTGPQAHVAWYGSSTSSLMPCDQLSPFLENFKVNIRLYVMFIHDELIILQR